MPEIELVDAASLALLGVAALRGFFRGAMRESFTLAAVAAAYICVRAFANSVAAWLLAALAGGVSRRPWRTFWRALPWPLPRCWP